MTRIAVLDDDKQCLDQLVEHATHYLDAHGGGHVDAFGSPDDLLAAHRPGAYDLLIFDCVFDKDRRSGVDVLLELRRRGDTTPAVLVTSSPDYAISGYAAGVRAYVLKPVTYGRLAAELDRLGVALTTPPRPQSALRLPSGDVVNPETIAFAQADRHYISIYDSAGTPTRIRMPFGQFEEELTAWPQLYHANRGLLVNLDFVSRLDGGDFVLFDGTRLPVARRQLSQAREALADRGFKRLRDGERL